MPRRLFKTRRRGEKQHARGEALCGIIVTAVITIPVGHYREMRIDWNGPTNSTILLR